MGAKHTEGSNGVTGQEAQWIDNELSGCEFKDKRLGKRYRQMLEQLWQGVGESIPYACQDWANTKAAYRFLSNDKVDEQQLLAGHFQSTKGRFAEQAGFILILHDTTEFSYQRENPEAIGITKIIPNGKSMLGQTRKITKCGILMHSSLAVTTAGLPLGLAAIKFWTRKHFKGSDALKRHINPTRMPIEQKESYRLIENVKQSAELFNTPSRCVHIGDRESDIYELFCTAKDLGTYFLVRTCVDRLAGEGKHTIAHELASAEVKGLHTIAWQDSQGQANEATLEIKYHSLQVLPPIGKQKKYPALQLTVIHAQEPVPPSHREPISWKLMTNLPINSLQEAIEKLNWYAMRWKIEVFHKILKAGCKAEESKLRAAERLANLIAIFCLLSWRIFWITMLNRCCINAPPLLAFTEDELQLLEATVKASQKHASHDKNLSYYLTQLAKLGGYLARASDPPPGNKVIWRGLVRLADIRIGFQLAMQLVGN